MPSISPFGSNSASGTPSIGEQVFCGALIQSFNCSADFSSQAGSLSVTLIEDEDNGYRFRAPVISQPTGIWIQDLAANTIFRFDGIVDSVARNSSPTEKVYVVGVSSPLKILQAVTVITDEYTGYGRSEEGLPRYFSQDGYYNISDSPADYLPAGVSKVPNVEYYQVTGVAFGTNNENLNYTGMWAKQFNLVNVFGAFENDSVGIVPFRGFGASANSNDGMTLDRVCYALDIIINKTSSAESQRYLGGNLLFGTNTYNICSVAAGYSDPLPYYYGFDAIGFYNQVRPYISANYRVKGPISILELITQVCQEINADFIINLDRVSYTSGDFTSYSNTTYSVYTTGQFELAQTYTDSLLGGVLWVQVIPRNVYVNCNRPFSDIAYNLLSLEKPNFGDYGTNAEINPGIIPTGYIDPLDSSYTSVGTRGSTPYGGLFPQTGTGNSLGDELSHHLNRATSMSVSVKAADSTTSKMIVGGYQTRMVNVPRDYIYQYWGNIKVQTTGAPNCTSLTNSSDKIIPVVTQILPPNDIVDMIMVDIQDIIPRQVNMWNPVYWDALRYWNGNVDTPSFITGVQYRFANKSNVVITPIASGVYFASVAEIRAAMQSIDEWEDFMTGIKAEKYQVLSEFLTMYSAYVNRIEMKKFNKFWTDNPTLSIGTKEYRLRKQKRDAVYTGAKRKLAIFTKIEEPEEIESDDFLEKLAEKLKAIGDEHYGRSWYAPIPFMKTKLTDDNDTLIGNYVRSWNLTDSAYVEPSLFYTIQAPIDSRFMDNGRLTPFVNFEFYSQSGNLGYDVFTNKITGLAREGKPTYDFGEYSRDDLVIDNSGCFPSPLVHTHPTSISNTYQYLPCNYFTVYNRYMAPFFDVIMSATGADPQSNNRINTLFGRAFYYDSPSKTGIMPSSVLNNCGTSSSFINSIFNEEDKLHEIDMSGVMATGYNGFFIQYPTSSNTNILTNLFNIRFSDHGLNSLPFVKFTTERVFFPHTNSSGISPEDEDFALRLTLLSQGLTNTEANEYINKKITSKSQFTSNPDYNLFTPILPPQSVCIPQVSTRFVYGPWMTNYDILYCGRSEFEVNPDLVPENYIIPSYGSLTLAGGSFSSGISDQTSGFAGMNLAGQAVANAIDNFSFFAIEEGTVTIPGLPLISRIGENLLSGPRITDIQVNFDNNEITTTYNFRQNSPRLGRTNRDVVKLLTRISKTLKR